MVGGYGVLLWPTYSIEGLVLPVTAIIRYPAGPGTSSKWSIFVGQMADFAGELVPLRAFLVLLLHGSVDPEHDLAASVPCFDAFVGPRRGRG